MVNKILLFLVISGELDKTNNFKLDAIKDRKLERKKIEDRKCALTVYQQNFKLELKGLKVGCMNSYNLHIFLSEYATSQNWKCETVI